ncbi:MAG: ribbon-helix-helix domain-containing protein [Elusimicrobia bacterium]|nr:ribbon-helix-helix domain-containing protein [Elusimicrobiota bacterium]
MTTQLATRIDPKAKKTLDKLHQKTHIPIRVLTEKAIDLLEEYYKRLHETHKTDTVNSNFAALLEHSLKIKDKTYQRLAG